MKKIFFLIILLVLFLLILFFIYKDFIEQRSIFNEPKLPIPLYEP